ncbi:MAG: hypothetical protein AB7I79_06255 [Rhizobiaceae bacterium]
MRETFPDWVPEGFRICPYFEPDPPDRSPDDTDEGYAWTVENHRGFALTCMVMLCLFQALCTLRGHPRECRRGKCRRTGVCSGRRDPRDWTSAFIGPVVPPCVPADTDIIIALRHAVLKKMDRMFQSEEGEPVFHFTEDDVAEMLAFVTPDGLPKRLDPNSPVSTGYVDRATGKAMTFDEMVADHWARDPDGMARATGRSGPPRRREPPRDKAKDHATPASSSSSGDRSAAKGDPGIHA